MLIIEWRRKRMIAKKGHKGEVSPSLGAAAISFVTAPEGYCPSGELILPAVLL